MSFFSVFTVVVILASLYGVARVAVWLIGMPERKRRHREMDELSARILAEQEARVVAEREKLDAAKHLLTGTDWRDPAGKEEFVAEVYDGELPEYLWFALPFDSLTPEETSELIEFFWGGSCRFGDLELHHSMNSGIGIALRIRKAKLFVAELTIRGEKCPLYQVGYSNWGYSEGGPCFLFQHLYGRPESRAA